MQIFSFQKSENLIVPSIFVIINFQVINKYIQNTKGSWRKEMLLNVWIVSRDGEVIICLHTCSIIHVQ